MDKETIKELEKLFICTSAGSLRQSLHEVFFSYLHDNKQGFPLHHTQVIEDFYLLMGFLERVERNSTQMDYDKK